MNFLNAIADTALHVAGIPVTSKQAEEIAREAKKEWKRAEGSP